MCRKSDPDYTGEKTIIALDAGSAQISCSKWSRSRKIDKGKRFYQRSKQVEKLKNAVV